MINLDYNNFLKDKDFDFVKQYLSDLKTITKFEEPNENIEERFDRYKQNDNSFKKVFKDYVFKDILLANTEEIKIIIHSVDSKIQTLTVTNKKETIKKIKNLFNYSDKYQSKVLTPFFTKNFNFRTCFYCNKDFITNLKKEKNELVSTFQLDHFFDKGTYPYLALSFYNLIPSCTTCNSSKVKGTKNTFAHDSKVGTFQNETCIAPNDERFDFHEKVKFKLILEPSCKDLHIKSGDDIDIPLKEQFTDEYDKYIEIFKLNERYKAHKDIVFEMIQKAELYPESRLKELQDLTGVPFQQIKKDIFNLIDEDDDLSKKPFSKLIKDISEELGLV
ncbi:MAG: hypothetical protein A2513_10990 [Sulfurimonas sp. RIFOXYD12_FULL_33_39]|uniref:hypothetical protein n=1 Tax=unclassified Sulfurimonas TaxID=2623549 RepID=UPI0008CC5A78|nr:MULTISPECIES: hypothetical protein [unclassified Sulfurimonas]OHE09829.1 MAG: hypothetical protein A2513_10990 [Sulfurimonas sp. RIFOXYD12_FULL_33_39]OHE13663.1 MAG: hypothetical protein A2530_08765 [Sulfurimonas sp. RIFOXYD2_FULL_34_21]